MFIGTDARVHFLRLAPYLSFLWMLYPVCWALSEGANVISPTSEMVFYGGKFKFPFPMLQNKLLHSFGPLHKACLYIPAFLLHAGD